MTDEFRFFVLLTTLAERQTRLRGQKKLICQKKNIRKEINHLKQICKSRKSINQFQDEQNEINWGNKYNHTNR